jgi:CRISPR-associated endonuclease/helicase Cas3
MNCAGTHFWGKTVLDRQGREVPGISVRDHCLNVGCVAEVLRNALPTSLQNMLRPGAATLAALHDAGKITVGFQAKCDRWLIVQALSDRSMKENWKQTSESNHGKVSAWVLRTWLKGRWPKADLDKLVHVIGAHHGALFGAKLFSKPLNEKGTDITDNVRQALCEELEALLDPLPAELKPLSDPELFLLAGLVSVADWIGSWIGSDEWLFPPAPLPLDFPPRSLEAARLDAGKAIKELGWRLPTLRPNLGFKDLFGFDSPSDLQQKAARLAAPPEVVLVEAAMGAGKTEAALALAYGLIEKGEAGGIYFALPTQVTSNRIHLRVHDFLSRCLNEPAMLRLAHMNSWLREDSTVQVPPAGRDDATPDTARKWFASSKRALLAPFGVGTIDQALLGVVAAKHFFVRQFALAGKVVVLDEVHSYDLYTGTLVAQLVRTLRELGATVVILSATLTSQRKRELLGLPKDAPLADAYPLLTILPRDGGPLQEQASSAGDSHEVQVRCVQLTEADAAAECLRRAEAGECVLWIRNTVAEAQAAMKRLRSDRCGETPELALLHSRFPLFRRERLERFWLNRLGKNPHRRPHGCVLVATQVVEQSVDIDADFLLTDLAPTDMLLQRIGRLWRHQGRPAMAARRPASAKHEVWVNHPALPGDTDAPALEAALGRSARVYAPYVLLRSLAEWQQVGKRGSLTLPTAIRPLLEATYDPGKEANDTPAWAELRRDLETQAAELRQKALSATRVWTLPDLEDEEGVQTRWSKLKTASLLLVRKARLKGKDGLELEPLHGRPFAIHPHLWEKDGAKAFAASKTIHRNLVRVDRWLVRDGITSTAKTLGPAAKALARHVHGEAAIGIVDGSTNGPIRWPGSEAPDSRLFYDEDLGVERLPRHTRTPPATTYLPDDDESDD